MARKPRASRSMAGRVALVVVATAAAVAAVTLAFDRWLDSPVLAGVTALLVTLPAAIWLTNRLFDRWSHSIRAVTDGIGSLRDRDFSVSVTPTGPDEIGDLTAEYNSLGDNLRRERLDLYQRELLLDTIVQTTPLALVLTNANDAIVFGNIAARQLFGAGRKLEGLKFATVLARAPQPLRDAVDCGTDSLFTVDQAGEAEIFHLSSRRFTLNGQPHRLLLFKQLTREMAAQEVAIWKKVIRVIAHELNNSLAPITSLAHSGQALAGAPDAERLAHVFSTIEERASHLATFIDGYARFAKLPRPRPAAVPWRPLLARLKDTLRFRVLEPLPGVSGLVRRAADRAGPHQPHQECGRVRIAGGRSDARRRRAQRRLHARGEGPRQRPLRGGVARRSVAVLLDQAQWHRARPHALPRDRGRPRRVAQHREPRGRRRGRDGMDTRRAGLVSTRLDERSPFALHVKQLPRTIAAPATASAAVIVRVWLPGQ